MAFSSAKVKINSNLNLQKSKEIKLKNNIFEINSDYEEIDYTQDTEEEILDEKKEVKNEITDFDKEEKMYNSLLDNLKEAYEDIDNKIDDLNMKNQAYLYQLVPFFSRSFEEVTGYESMDKFDEDLKNLKNDKAMYESFIYQLEEKLKNLPYEQIQTTDSYKEFAKDYKMLNEGAAFEVLAKDKSYQYMNLEQRKMFDYLFEKEGIDSAQEYLDSIQDSINQAKGAEQASKFLDSLDINDKGKLEDNLANLFGVSTKGLNDGILTFFDGLNNALTNNDVLTADEYEKILILEYLQENSNILDETYQFSSSLGNMLPAISTSILVSALATPAAGAITASALMGTSAFGNAKHQALTEGNDLLSSTIYGALIGTSEATLGYFLGKIPGISETSGLTLKNLLCEGAEEFSQEWIDAGLQAVVLGKDVKWEEIPTQAGESFVMGFLMAGLLNGGQSIVNLTIDGVKYDLNVEDTLDYIAEHPDISIEEAIEKTNPSFFSKLFNKSDNSLKNIDEQVINDRVDRYNGDYVSAFADLLYEKSLDSNSYQVRLVARDLLNYLKSRGFADLAAANMLSAAGTGAINYRGFNRSYADINGHSIVVNEQKNIDYSGQAHRPDAILNMISTLPPELISLVQSINFYDTFNPADFYWEYQYQMKDFYSCATGGGGEINFYLSKSSTFHTVVHEIAHSYDSAYASAWGVQGRISNSKIWLDAMKADQQQNGLNGISDYARSSNSPSEDFADSVAAFYCDPHALDKFPNRKAILSKMLPQKYTVASAYQLALDALTSKYGAEKAKNQMQRYVETGNILEITRYNDARKIISSFSLDEIRQYHEMVLNSTSVTVDLKTSQAFDLAFGAMIRKYGADQAVKNMQQYIDTGDINLITRTEGARNAIEDVSLENIKVYVKSLTGGSLDIKKLIGG